MRVTHPTGSDNHLELIVTCRQGLADTCRQFVLSRSEVFTCPAIECACQLYLRQDDDFLLEGCYGIGLRAYRIVGERDVVDAGFVDTQNRVLLYLTVIPLMVNNHFVLIVSNRQLNVFQFEFVRAILLLGHIGCLIVLLPVYAEESLGTCYRVNGYTLNGCSGGLLLRVINDGHVIVISKGDVDLGVLGYLAVVPLMVNHYLEFILALSQSNVLQFEFVRTILLLRHLVAFLLIPFAAQQSRATGN